MLAKHFQPLLCWVFFVAFCGQAIRNTIDWAGYGVVVLFTVGLLSFYVFRYKKPINQPRLSPVIIYILITFAVSVVFSSYRLWGLLGLFITVLTGYVAWIVSKYYRWAEIKLNLWVSLMVALILSYILEIVVSIIGTPLLPLYLNGVEDPPGLFYWVQGVLFEGGPIQGIVGNRNLLGFIALLCLLLSVFNRELETKWKVVGSAVSSLTVFLTASATITVAIVGCFIATGVVLVMRAWRTKYERTKYLLLTFFTGAVLTSVILLYRPIMGVLNREPDMTNRFDIWLNVWHLFIEKPIIGWGWIGHWVPFVDPFDTLAVLGRVTHLHAHNAYLDVLFQTGILGLIGVIVLLLFTGIRAWKIAVDRGTSKSMVPLVLLLALLIQAMTESRLLLEGNLLLLLLIVFYVQKETPVFTEIVGEFKTSITGPIRTID